MTESWLVSEMAGSADAQFKFQMTPESWSITDVVEHLAIAEPQYWQRVHDSMKQPPTTEKLEATDAGIMWYGIDRTNRARTGEARVPQASYDDVGQSLAEFRKLRATMIDIREVDGRGPAARKLLEGNMDVYQWS